MDSTRIINWSRYDNWSKASGSWVFGTSDSVAEMIIMNYRAIPNIYWFWAPGNGGVANLGFDTPITLGNIKIDCDNGVTVLNLLHSIGRSEINIEHEFSHKLYGQYGIPFCEVDGFHINMGFMTSTTSNTSYIMTPMERSADVVQYIPISVIDQTGIYTYTLPDYTESGESYKIKVPGTSSDYIWIANHQKKSLYDGIARGGSNCYDINFAEIDPECSDGKGLFVYKEGPASSCVNINQSYDIISAEGKFNWDSNRTVHVPLQNYHFPLDIDLTIFNKSTGSRYNGRDKYRKSVNFTQQYLTDDECSSEVNAYSVSWINRGDKFDAFNIGYDEIFSPYSNPATGSCDSTLTGLTIALMEQNSTTGSIVVKIYYNNDAQALFDLPPSKPKNLRVVKDFFGADTGIYGGGDPGTFHPKITWDKNIEPDFYTTSYLINPTEIQPMYELYRGYSTDCEIQPEYTLVVSLPHTDTVYVDSSTVLYDPDHATVAHCASDFLTYSYKLLAKDTRGNRSLKSERGLVSGYSMDCSPEDDGPASNNGNGNENLNEPPAEFSLKQNYPNPFNPVTHLEFGIPDLGFVSLKVYDMLGKEVKTLVNEIKPAGIYNMEFDGSDLPSGIYYYKIESGNFTQVRKMILLK